MASHLDLVGIQIKIISMMEGRLLAEKDIRACMDIHLGIAFVTGKIIDTAAKKAEEGNIRTLTFTDFKWRPISRTMTNHVMDHEIVAKSIGPNFGR